MTHTRKSFDVLDSSQKRKVMKDIVDYYTTEHDEEIGVIKAEDILDFFLETLHPHIHNNAIEEAKSEVKNKFDELDVDLELLRKEKTNEAFI